jgi:ATP-binding cassette subfamily B protein
VSDLQRARLADLPLLRFLPPDTRTLVVDSFEPVTFTFGQTIVREGEDADAFFVITAGQARVIKTGMNGEEVPLNVLRAGDSFGETSLLEEIARTATVRASGDVETFKLDRSVFAAMVRNNPELRGYLELQSRHRNLYNFFRLNSAFDALPLDALTLLLSQLDVVKTRAGERVVRAGDPPGPMYFVEEGRLRVFVGEDGNRRYLAYLRKGDYFGEKSLLTGTPRAGSVEAVSDCSLLRLNPATFARLLQVPQFKKQIDERVSQYDYQRVANVPLDFAEEMLPAEASVEQVGEDQVDEEAGTPDGPFASPDGFFVKKHRRIRRMTVVRQIDEMDCGAASLAMVCRHFGRAVSLARIRQLVHTSLDGTSLRGLCTAATELGLAARSVKASPNDLAEMPLPAIVHWDGNHWLVLYDVRPGRVSIADPASGLRRISRDEFHQKWSGYAALFDYTQAFEQAPEGKTRLAWLWPFFKPFSRLFAQAVGLAVVVSTLQMVIPVLTQVVVDRVLVDQDVNLLNMLSLTMLVVLVFIILSMVIQRYLLSFAAVRIDASTLDFLTRRLLELPMTYFMTRRTGDIQRRLEGIRRVREFVVQNGVTGLTAITQLVSVLVLMFVYSPLLGSVFLITAPLHLVLMWFSARYLRPTFDMLEEAFGRYHSYQIDAIKGVEAVKAMGGEHSFREMMLGEFHQIARRQFRADFTVMTYEGAVQGVTLLSLVLFLWVGAYQVLNGSLTIGAFVAFNALVALANQPIFTLLALWDGLQSSSVLLNRLNDVFEQDPEQGADRSRLLPVRALEGRVRLQNVGFQYGGPESPKILDGISFEVPPGKMVAIVGRSGSGKTTLIKCLAGLVEPTEGTIFYDGIDLKTLNYRQLRRQMGFVLQENYIFADTIARNIAFGEDTPDMDRVIWATRAANAHDFIDRFPLGYETRIGETGIAISGGQRQRVAIARALYHRPPVLIFDEATSSLDTESERAIQENLDKLLEGRTSFVIAHRLSTIRNADMVIVLEKGRLVEQGSHDELMQRQGLYYYLNSQQLAL